MFEWTGHIASVDRNGSAAELLPATMLCVMGVLWTDSSSSLLWAAPTAVVVGAGLAVTARFGQANRNLGPIVVAGVAVLALYGMIFTGYVPSIHRIAPLVAGTGLGIAARPLYAVTSRLAPNRRS